MINKLENISVVVVIEHEQQWVQKLAKSTVRLHSLWDYNHVTAEAGGWVRAVVYYCMSLHKGDRERARDQRRGTQVLPQ
jgi:hypothetical protein